MADLDWSENVVGADGRSAQAALPDAAPKITMARRDALRMKFLVMALADAVSKYDGNDGAGRSARSAIGTDVDLIHPDGRSAQAALADTAPKHKMARRDAQRMKKLDSHRFLKGSGRSAQADHHKKLRQDQLDNCCAYGCPCPVKSLAIKVDQHALAKEKDAVNKKRQAVEDEVAGTLVLTGDALKKEAQVAVKEAD